MAERSSSGRTSSAARPLLDDTPVAEPPPLLESSGSGTDAGADASVAWLAWPATPLAEAAATLSPAVLPVTVIDSLEGLALEASPVKDDRAEVVRVQCHLGARADSAEVTITDFGPWGLRYDLGGRADRGASVSLGAPAGIPGEPVGCTVAWCRKKPRRDEYRVSLLYSATVEELSRTWMGQLASALCPTLEQLGSRFQEFEVPVRQGGVSGRLLDLGLSGARVRLDSPRPAGRGELVLGPWQDLTEVVIPGQLTEHGQFRFVPEAGPSVPALGSYLLRLIRSIG
ncbi:MAG: hypothetical protein HY319_07820 [Armatimonadetes bacterium]|nr:hypothetical protein [Armatimonadota bacterium]